RRCERETLVGLRPPDVPHSQRKVAYFCAAQWPTFAPPLTVAGCPARRGPGNRNVPQPCASVLGTEACFRLERIRSLRISQENQLLEKRWLGRLDSQPV